MEKKVNSSSRTEMNQPPNSPRMNLAANSPNRTEVYAAHRLGVAIQTLRNWRALRRGPAYLKIGRAVRYRDQDLDQFIERNRIDPEGSKL